MVLIEGFYFRLVTGTTSATVGTQTAHTHGLGVSPDFIIIIETSNGIVYRSASSDATNIYVKGSAASLTFDAVCIVGK